MNASKRYVLDANAFIEAKNRYYGLDICPGFWDALVAQHDAKRIFSIDRIRAELSEQGDEIKGWVENQARPLNRSLRKRKIRQSLLNFKSWFVGCIRPISFLIRLNRNLQLLLTAGSLRRFF
jgi:hypothetical protein